MHPVCDNCDEDATQEILREDGLVIKHFCDKCYDEYMERKDKK